MGSMSASDAAPLPRLGEVYFDVRGESRSMRLSWYADTGVAVFSIWQGGTCTGTFRLPIADLPRMVQALQRGPEGEAGRPAQPATGQTRREGPVHDPKPPAALDIDVERDAHRSRGGRHHEDDRAATGYSGDRPSRYPDELTGEYGEPPGAGYSGSERPGGYGDEPGGGYPGGMRAPGYEAAAYREEPPTGVYHEDDAGYSSGGYEREPAGPYPDDSLPAYPDESLPAYAGESLPAYPDDGLPGSGASYHDEGYGPAGPYPGGSAGRHGRDRAAAYPGGGHEDEPTGVYRGGLLPEDYEDEPVDRYPGGEYPVGPVDPDYPTGPSEPDYPGAMDPRDYPVPPGNQRYSPARPYVGPRPQDAGPPAEERVHEPRRSRGRQEDDPAPGSFPYGQPPGEREARGRRR